MGNPQDKMPRTFECAAVLFDLDGVLIDSTECIMRHWQLWADQNAVDIQKIAQVAHGLRTIETMRLVAPHLDVDHEAELFKAHELIDTQGITAIDGACRILTTLPTDAWTIVTSGSRDLVKARMSQAGLPVPDRCITADDVRQGKPSPEPYLLGARHLGFRPEDCIVIEDAPSGIEAGKKAGMRVIAIASTHTRQALHATGVDAIVDKLSDLDIRTTDNGGRLTIRLK